MNAKPILLATCLFPFAAMACGADDGMAFSCTTTKGKYVEVCQTPKEVTYSFGKLGQKPEMNLRVPTAQLDWTTSGGSGMNFDTITFHNGKTAYMLDIESEFGTDDGSGQGSKPATTATLNVRNGTTSLATLECEQKGLQKRLERLTASPRAE